MSKDNTESVPSEKAKWADSLATKWLSKNIGRSVEFYLMRAPKVTGILRAVDERFGRCVIETDEEEVIVWMSGITQIRMTRDNGHTKRGADSK